VPGPRVETNGPARPWTCSGYHGGAHRAALSEVPTITDSIPTSPEPSQRPPDGLASARPAPDLVTGESPRGPDGAGRWWRSPLYRDVALLLVVNRLVLFVVAWLGHHLVPSGQYLAGGAVAAGLPDLFTRFDAHWYLSIVREGYRYSPSEATNVVFFPLFPMLVRGLAATGLDAVMAGFALSNICLAVALVLLARLVALELGDDPARRTVTFILLFPTSFFFSACYTESLFLMLTVASFLAARRRRWWLAGAAGGLAAATRMPGAVLVVPLALEYMQQNGFRLRRVRLNGAALALIPAGLGLFAWYCGHAFGDPLAFLHNQTVWHGRPTHAVPGVGLLIGVAEAILRPDPSIHPFPLTLLYVGAAVVAVVCLLGSFLVLRPAYGLWGLAVLSISAGHGRIDSLPRYVLVLFPIHVVLAVLARRRGAYWAIAVVSASLLVVLTVMFVNGYKMF